MNEMKERTKLMLIILSGSLFFLASCSKFPFPWPPKNPNTSSQDVYVAGYEGEKAILWKNGEANYLTDGTLRARAVSVFVSDGVVYVAGYEGNKAMLWKNGVGEELPNGDYANSVFVKDGDVYVAGKGSGTYWKNGNLVDFGYVIAGDEDTGTPDYTAYTEGYSAFVSGSDVYIGGSLEIGQYHDPVIWKNGDTIRTSGDNGMSYNAVVSVFVDGTDVHAVGYYWDEPFYWKNGTLEVLPDPDEDDHSMPRPYAVFVWNSDVYISGTYDNKAFLRQNGVYTFIPQMTSAGSVFVNESGVFIAGQNFPEKKATLYIDGTIIDLTDGTQFSGANSVYVVKR